MPTIPPSRTKVPESKFVPSSDHPLYMDSQSSIRLYHEPSFPCLKKHSEIVLFVFVLWGVLRKGVNHPGLPEETPLSSLR